MGERSGPVLVTGMPRSGSTWTARLIATAHRASLPGREPMNARNRQYALAGTLDGWTRLGSLSARQSIALRASYAGVNPFTFSRYGTHRARALRHALYPMQRPPHLGAGLASPSGLPQNREALITAWSPSHKYCVRRSCAASTTRLEAIYDLQSRIPRRHTQLISCAMQRRPC